MSGVRQGIATKSAFHPQDATRCSKKIFKLHHGVNREAANMVRIPVNKAMSGERHSAETMCACRRTVAAPHKKKIFRQMNVDLQVLPTDPIPVNKAMSGGRRIKVIGSAFPQREDPKSRKKTASPQPGKIQAAVRLALSAANRVTSGGKLLPVTRPAFRPQAAPRHVRKTRAQAIGWPI
jgi:hypothetical protein